jgi:hypothetical protein
VKKKKMAAALKDRERKFMETLENSIYVFMAKQWQKKSVQKEKEFTIRANEEK